MAEKYDFVTQDHGSIVLLKPLSEAGKIWIDEHIGQGDEVQYWGDSVVVEPRYIRDIIDGIEADGYKVL